MVLEILSVGKEVLWSLWKAYTCHHRIINYNRIIHLCLQHEIKHLLRNSSNIFWVLEETDCMVMKHQRLWIWNFSLWKEFCWTYLVKKIRIPAADYHKMEIPHLGRKTKQDRRTQGTWANRSAASLALAPLPLLHLLGAWAVSYSTTSWKSRESLSPGFWMHWFDHDCKPVYAVVAWQSCSRVAMKDTGKGKEQSWKQHSHSFIYYRSDSWSEYMDSWAAGKALTISFGAVSSNCNNGLWFWIKNKISIIGLFSNVNYMLRCKDTPGKMIQWIK